MVVEGNKTANTDKTAIHYSSGTRNTFLPLKSLFFRDVVCVG